MSDLLTQPLWQADSLGSPLPDNEFGVSVSLPLWRHVIGYEEGDKAVTSTFRSGYPRFFVPPAIERLFTAAEQRFASKDERCLVFPAPGACASLRGFCPGRRPGGDIR